MPLRTIAELCVLAVFVAPAGASRKASLEVFRTAFRVPGTSPASLTTVSSVTGADVDPVDMVYCWAGETNSSCGNVSADHLHGCDQGQLQYSLRSVAKYAPWVRKVYLLVNGPKGSSVQHLLPSFINKDHPGPDEEDPTKTTHVEMINRCDLFNNAEDCPTGNVEACMSVVHRVPGLANKFMYSDDDMMFINPVTRADFWDSEGRVLVYDGMGNQDFWDSDGKSALLYGPDEELSGPNLPPKHRPRKLTEQTHHSATPLLLNAVVQLEETYPEWFAFVRSHKKRFICCDISHPGSGSVTEVLDPIWKHWFLQTGHGIINNSSRYADPLCPMDMDSPGQKFPSCFQRNFVSKEYIFFNMNSMDPKFQKEAKAILNEKLSEPAPWERAK